MKTHANREIKSNFRHFPGYGSGRVVLRYDDSCGNGYDTFSITVDSRAQIRGAFGGCMHKELAKVFPEYAHLIKWHGVSDDGPLHYIANTVYHAQNGNLEYARSSAIAPRMTLEALQDTRKLAKRLPALMRRFRATMATIDWSK